MRCNEYRKTGIAGRNTIEFRFAAPPSGIRICLGDVDPMTGNSLEDAGLFRLYHVLQNSQAYYSYRDRKAPFTKEQAERRESLRQDIAEAFERDHGYAPGRENLRHLLEERWPTPYTVSLEELTFADEAVYEKDPRFTCPAAEGIITTHNPLFVQQNKLNANILVDGGTARAAKNVSEIRQILGVLPSDNLQSARFVLLVEGENDKISLNKILSLKSVILKNALSNNQLYIKPMMGASNLAHDALDLKNSLCTYCVLLDHDKAGEESAAKAKQAGIIKDAQLKYTICNGMTESEFEDCLKVDVYAKAIMDEFSVNVKRKEFKGKKKWSERMKNVFYSCGSEWSDAIEKKVKYIVAHSVSNMSDSLDSILIPEKSGFIDGLVMALENMVQNV